MGGVNDEEGFVVVTVVMYLLISQHLHDPRIRILHQDSKGKAAALNYALSKLRGESYAAQDADDRLRWATLPGSVLPGVAALDQREEGE